MGIPPAELYVDKLRPNALIANSGQKTDPRPNDDQHSSVPPKTVPMRRNGDERRLLGQKRYRHDKFHIAEEHEEPK